MRITGVSYLLCYFLVIGCTKPISEETQLVDLDTSEIPNDTVSYTDDNLIYKNGRYLVDSKLFSGIVHKVLKGYDVNTYSSVLNGQLHGTYQSFFSSGAPYEIRTYRNGLSTGEHYGFWEETGKLKFEYHYIDQKKVGSQKNWYSNGDPAYSYNYKNDRLDGLQKAWRVNGSLYRNFEVKEGIIYGLQRSKTCYEISEGNLVLQAYKTD